VTTQRDKLVDFALETWNLRLELLRIEESLLSEELEELELESDELPSDDILAWKLKKIWGM
jgi:hypothetical protein